MSHMNMVGMNAGGGALGGMPLMNNGANGATPRTGIDQEDNDFEARLNTHIYDFFLKSKNFECARALLKSGVAMEPQVKRRDGDINGTDDIMQTDSKDDLDTKRPDDLPPAPGCSDGLNFLLDWYSLFWDFFFARTNKAKATPQAVQYMQHSRFRQDQQLLRGAPATMGGGMDYQQMLRFQQVNGDLRQKALQNNNRNVYPATPHQIAQIKNQQPMRRDPSDLDINGQRPRTPSGGENAPSPSKRARLDAVTFGQQMMPNGRVPPQGLQGQPMMENQNNLHASVILMQNGIDPNGLSPAQMAAFQHQNPSVQQKSMQVLTQTRPNQQRPGLPKSGLPGQGSPMMQSGMEFSNGEYYNVNPTMQMRGGQLPNGPAGPIPNGTGGNHALQDYQMQLMLLEQQNKKRLLMARQDHDNPPRPEGQAGVPGAPGFAPGMSPQGSRSGPSPGPSDQLKRVSPKLNPSGLPNGGSPMPDGNLSRQGGSPAAMNYTGQMTPDMMQQIKMGDGMGVAGANGMRPPSSHPQHPQFGGAPYTPQQMEQMRAARGAGPLPNGNWPQTTQGQPGMMQQPAQAPQPSQVGTPQQRAMPPPAAVPAGTATNGRPASPPSTANPPSTPSQSTKANPKAKKDGKEARKRPTKKTSNAGAPASTPATDADNPPATPITPMAQASFSQPKNDAQNQATLMQNVASASNTASVAQSQPDANPIPQFPNLEGNENDYNIGAFSTDMAGDVLENFDFDSFLQSTEDGFQFDSINFSGDGVEASAGDA